jgi:ubiquinone/menaquinone biosynthesis C-methylase UbiE
MVAEALFRPKTWLTIQKILYVGVGGGMELLQFSYFSRKRGVVGVDVVDEMLEASRQNFIIAEQEMIKRICRV